MQTLAADDVFTPLTGPVENDRLKVDAFADHPVVFAGKFCDFDVLTVDDEGQHILIAKKPVVMAETEICPELQKRRVLVVGDDAGIIDLFFGRAVVFESERHFGMDMDLVE